LLDLWIDLLSRFAVESVLPAAGLIAATAGVLFAIYYWTRLGNDQLLARCAMVAVVLHLLGFVSLFRLPSTRMIQNDPKEVRVSLEWRSADEVRGEQALAEWESTRADLPEEVLDPAPTALPNDAEFRPDRSDDPQSATPLPSLDEPPPRPTEPTRPIDVDTIPLPETTPALAEPVPPTQFDPPALPAEPPVSPSAERKESVPAPVIESPPIADRPADPREASKSFNEGFRVVDEPVPVPAEMEQNPPRMVSAERRILPDPAVPLVPEESEGPARPVRAEPVPASPPPVPVDASLEANSPPPGRPMIDPVSDSPEKLASLPPEPMVVALAEPPEKPTPTTRPEIEPSIDLPVEVVDIARPQREPAPSSVAPVDIASLAKRSDTLPREPVLPRTFWENRIAPNRMEIVQRHGGSEETEKAVAAALAWLAAHQSEDGRWDSDGFDRNCPAGDLCEGHAVERQSDTGLTGLSLLAFLGAGHTHLSEGPYRETVRRGLSWLLRTQQADGDLQYGGRIYAHAMATISITEAFAMTKDGRLKGPAQRGILWLARAQHPESGGWRYGPGQFGDTSVYGWAVLALRSAKQAGLEVPDTTWLAARRWLPLVVSGRHRGLAAYRPGYPPSHAMTAEALFCRQVLEGRVEASLAAEAADHLMTKLPDPSDYHLYYWYYGTLCLFQMGGPAWERWNDRLTSTLVGSQVRSGHAEGSWDPGVPFGVDGGRVFATACSCLCLEVYYRYLPLYQAGPGSLSSPPALR
jgi:hypothetical protein